MLDSYLALHNAVEHLSDTVQSFDVWSIRLLLSFYARRGAAATAPAEAASPVLQADFVASIRARMGSFFEACGFDGDLREYLQSGAFPADPARQGLFSCMLVFMAIPPPAAAGAAPPADKAALSALLLRQALMATADEYA